MKITMSKTPPSESGFYLWSEFGGANGLKIAHVHSTLRICTIDNVVANPWEVGGYWCEIESIECADNIPTLGDADRVVGPTDYTEYMGLKRSCTSLKLPEGMEYA